MKFSYMAGVVGADDRSRFERQLFRTTRGNCYVRFAEIEQPISDPATGESIMKLVFIVFYKVGTAASSRTAVYARVSFIQIYQRARLAAAASSSGRRRRRRSPS